MLFNLTYDLTFEEFAEAMRHFPLRMKGGANRIIWLVAAVILGVWIILARSLGKIDPAPPRPAQTMSTAEAFYLLWMVAFLFICLLLPIVLKRFRQIWHQRVVILVSTMTFLGMCLLGTLAGSTPRKIGEEPPGFWTIQRDYLTLTIMLIVVLGYYLGALSVERFRGNWNLHYMFHETQTFRVLQDAIERDTPMRNDRVLYAAIRTNYETPNTFALFDGIQLFIIPKRALGGFNEIQNFRSVMAEKLSGRTFAFPVRQLDDKG
jgi:hypothetical protein